MTAKAPSPSQMTFGHCNHPPMHPHTQNILFSEAGPQPWPQPQNTAGLLLAPILVTYTAPPAPNTASLKWPQHCLL